MPRFLFQAEQIKRESFTLQALMKTLISQEIRKDELSLLGEFELEVVEIFQALVKKKKLSGKSITEISISLKRLV